MNTRKAAKPPAKAPATESAFQLAVHLAKLDVPPHFAAGLGAIKGGYRACIQASDARRLRGSLDIDSALASSEPGSHRWDYGVGFQLAGNGPEVAVWIEFHPAFTREVDAVIKKYEWLRGKLSTHRPLGKLTEAAGQNGIRPFHWLPSGSGVHIPAHTPQARKLAAKGLAVAASFLRLP